MIVSWFGFLPSRLCLKFILESRQDCFFIFPAFIDYKNATDYLTFAVFNIVGMLIGCFSLKTARA